MFFKSNTANRIREQRKIGLTVLNKLACVSNTPIYIMGGAPRDWRLLKPARDIDVYLPADKSDEYMYEYRQSCGDLAIALRQGHKYGNFISHTCVGELSRIAPTNYEDSINLIFYDPQYTAQDILHKNFGFNICQAVMTITGTTMYTEGFEDAIMRNTITALNGMTRDNMYAQKIEGYFPDYKFEY